MYIVTAAVINLISIQIFHPMTRFQAWYSKSTEVCLSEIEVDFLNYACPLHESYDEFCMVVQGL
jgi:hypothetical protein